MSHDINARCSKTGLLMEETYSNSIETLALVILRLSQSPVF